MVENMKCQSWKESLEGVQALGFDLLAEIEYAMLFEAKSRKLAYPDEENFEGSECSYKPEGSGDPEGEDASPAEY